MNKYTNKFVNVNVAFGLILAASIINAPTALAQYYSDGGNNPVLVIDKKVRPINETKFSDNLTSADKVFVEGDQIEFSIRVENRGNVALSNIKVSDYLPAYLKLMFYPGTLNKDETIFETIIDNLNPGEAKEFLVRARITSLPTSNFANSLRQMTNRVCAVNSKASDCDNSKYFVGLATTPATGSNDLIVKSAVVVSLLGVALATRKLARGY